MTSNDREKATLLVVDDTPFNLKVVLSYLQQAGFRVDTAENGAVALKKVAAAPPDLILLDAMMPQMDGFSTCKWLKNDPLSRDIPVIFMTSLNEVADKLKAFEAGAVDYITKPVEAPELLARVQTHLQLRRLRAFLEQQSESLREKNLELEQQYKELNTFAQCMTADLKKPLGAMAGFMKVLDKDLKALKQSHLVHFLDELEQTRARMSGAVDNLLLLAGARTRQITYERLNMAAISTAARERVEKLCQQKQAHVATPAAWPEAWGYAPWVEKIWEIYLCNAVRYGGSPLAVEIGGAPQEDGQVRFWVKDNGPGLGPDEQGRLGDGRVEMLMGADGPELARTKEGYGLELSIVQRLVERLGGYVGLDSQPGKGSTFYFTLPATRMDHAGG